MKETIQIILHSKVIRTLLAIILIPVLLLFAALIVGVVLSCFEAFITLALVAVWLRIGYSLFTYLTSARRPSVSTPTSDSPGGEVGQDNTLRLFSLLAGFVLLLLLLFLWLVCCGLLGGHTIDDLPPAVPHDWAPPRQVPLHE